MSEFWIPTFKWQFVEWFKRQRPGWNVKSWSRKKLTAVYIKIRKGESDAVVIPEKIIPAMPEREIEEVFYQCPESILATGEEDSNADARSVESNA